MNTVEDLSRLKHNLAAKRSRDRKKLERLSGQASTSTMIENILSHEKLLGTQDKADMASADMAKDADVTDVLTW